MKRRRWIDESDLWVLTVCLLTLGLICAQAAVYLWRLYH